MRRIVNKTISMDTETTGPDFWNGCKPFMVTATLYDGAKSQNMMWQWDVEPTDRSKIYTKKKEIEQIRNLAWNNKVVFHNAMFDIPALASIGVFDAQEFFNEGDYEDTMYMMGVLYPNDERGLKRWAMLIGIDTDDESDLHEAVTRARMVAKELEWDYATENHDTYPAVSQVDGGFKKFDYWLPRALKKHKPDTTVVRGDECEKYAALDGERTICLYYPLRNELEKQNLTRIYEFNRDLMPMTWEMRSHGLPIHNAKLKRLKRRFGELVTEYQNKAKELSGNEDFNTNSPKQICALLFDEWKIKPLKLTDKNNPSTDQEALKAIVEDPKTKEKHKKFCRSILVSRTCDKVKSQCQTYLSAAEWGKENGGIGRLHPDLTPMGNGMKVNRYSCSVPNIQAIRKRPWDLEEMANVNASVREMVVPPEGREIVSIDFDQLHLRMIAYLSNEKKMIEIYENNGDIHELMAKEMFGDAYNREDKGQRRKAKDVNYGFIYGATREKIFQYSGLDWLYDHLHRTFPNAPIFLREKDEEARRTGCVMCADGTRLFLPSGKEFAAVNYFIQGTEGYLMKQVLHDVRAMRKRVVKVAAQVHDELLFEGPSGWHKTAEFEKVRTIMRSAGRFIGVKCEISADLITSDSSWYKGVPIPSKN